MLQPPVLRRAPYVCKQSWWLSNDLYWPSTSVISGLLNSEIWRSVFHHVQFTIHGSLDVPIWICVVVRPTGVAFKCLNVVKTSLRDCMGITIHQVVKLLCLQRRSPGQLARDGGRLLVLMVLL